MLVPIKNGDEIHITMPTYGWFYIRGEYELKSEYFGSVSEADVLEWFEEDITDPNNQLDDSGYLHKMTLADDRRFNSTIPYYGASAVLQDQNVNIQNARVTQNLALSKILIYGSTASTATFKLTLWDGEGNHKLPISGYTIPGTSYTTNANGEAVITLQLTSSQKKVGHSR